MNFLLEKVGIKKIKFKDVPDFYPWVNYAKNLLFYTKNQIKNLMTFKFSNKQFISFFYKNYLEIEFAGWKCKII